MTMANEAVLDALNAIVNDAPVQAWGNIDAQLTTLYARINDGATGGTYGGALYPEVLRPLLVQGQELRDRRDATGLAAWALFAEAFFL